MKRIIVLFVVAILVASCATKPSQVSTVDGVYVNRLNARLTQYNQNAAELDASVKQRAEASAVQSVAAEESAPNPTLSDVIRDFTLAAELHGRAAVLDRFMREAAVSGQIGLMYSWLQNQALELTRFSKDTDTRVAPFQRDAMADPQNSQLAMRFYTLMGERGSEQGAGEELLAISNDVQGYARDYAGAASVDRQRQEDYTRLLEAYLSAPRVNVQAPAYVQAPRLPTLTTCNANGFTVSCFSN
jgi:hypothetical protein